MTGTAAVIDTNMVIRRLRSGWSAGTGTIVNLLRIMSVNAYGGFMGTGKFACADNTFSYSHHHAGDGYQQEQQGFYAAGFKGHERQS
jgi:hypothetical protein